MSHPLETLLTTYFSQQEEMGIPTVLVGDTPENQQVTQPEPAQHTPSPAIPEITQQLQPTPTVQEPLVEEEPAISAVYEEKPVQQVDTPSIPEPTPPTHQVEKPHEQAIQETPQQPATIQTAPQFQQNAPRDRDTIRKELADLYYRSKECTACSLCQSRNSVVFGSGNATADILIVGEAPGFEEDQQGLPFVGPAGQLLTKMLQAINVDREKETFICNVLKCRPPGNRTPSTQESLTCLPILKRQIAIIRPKIILLLGKTAASTVLDREDSINKLRGHEYNYHGIPTYVSYHPAALLRNSTLKRPAWEDLQKLQVRYRELIDG